MSTLGKFIQDISPKFNKEMVEGLCYHRLNNTVDYIDNFIRYSCVSKTSTNLKYLGYEEVDPKEELKLIFNKRNKVEYDIAENDIYLVKFLFRYGEEDVIREQYMYLPYMHKGNIIKLSGNKFLVMPTLADKVVSIGDKVIFLNILTAKYTVNRLQHVIIVNDVIMLAPIIASELYKNQSKNTEDTTKANSTIIHYLLATYGYSEAMRRLLGFVPQPTYDVKPPKGFVEIKSTGNVPKGWVGDKNEYSATRIRFIVPEDQYNNNVYYILGNVMYILDNFPDRITIDRMDDYRLWRRLMGEIIHSGNHKLHYLNEKMHAHFNDLSSVFDVITINKLEDVGIKASNLLELLETILMNFNEWALDNDGRSLYNRKSYEVESYVLNLITSGITRLVLDINKEELRLTSEGTKDGIAKGPNMELESGVVDKLFKKHLSLKTIFKLRKEKRFVTSIDYSGDHLYFKNTALIIQQESDYINIANSESNTSERDRMVASMATVGSVLGLSKRNPTPLIRLNPYVTTDPNTGTVLDNPKLSEIISATDILLANMGEDIGYEDIDEIEMDFDEHEPEYDDSYDNDFDDDSYDE